MVPLLGDREKNDLVLLGQRLAEDDPEVERMTRHGSDGAAHPFRGVGGARTLVWGLLACGLVLAFAELRSALSAGAATTVVLWMLSQFCDGTQSWES
jgi:hypothetical protein